MLNISLPNQVTDFIEQQSMADGFATPSEYVFDLVLREQARLAQQKRIESMLLEGLNSGASTEMTDDWWSAKRANLEQLHRSPA